jgi:hypothetical protein
MVRVDGRRNAQQSGRVPYMDDIFGEIVEETAEEVGGEIAEEIVEGLFD